MKNHNALLISAVVALCGVSAWAQTARISSVAIAPATGIVAVTERIGTATNVPTSVSDNLAGLAYAADNVPLTGDLSNSPVSIALFAITGRNITGGAQVDDFKGYGTIISPNTSVATYLDIRGKFTSQAAFYPPGPNSYSGLIWLPTGDTLGLPGPHVFYTIHHRPSGDYFSVIVPGTSNSSDAYDLKPMSAAGVVTDPSTTGYFGLAYASVAPAASYNANDMYYLRTAGAVDAYPAGHIVFGSMIPALTSGPTDRFDLNVAVGSFGVAGYKALTFSPNDLGDGVNQFYYLRQDTTGTGNTILGRLNPSLISGVRTISDIANLGGVFDTLTLAVAATGPASSWTTSATLFVSGAPLATGAQSISFAAIADRTLLGDVPFIVTPTASSGQDITVTVVSGPATVVNSGTGGTRIATVTDTGPGVVKLRATQSGTGGFNANWLEQSYNVLGLPSITSASTASATAGTPFTFNLTATGAPIISYAATGFPTNGLTFAPLTGVISGTPVSAGTINVTGITATNATGTSTPATTLTITVAAAGVAPVINSALTASGTVGAAFGYTITASNSPTSFSAAPLPAGVTRSGAILSGTPTTAGTTSVTLGATNATGTGNATLTITIAAAPAAPISTPGINNSPLTAAGTVGSPFSFTITASGSPTNYAASPLPAGLTINTSTGAITGTPSTVGTTSVSLGATNSAGTGTATLMITVVAARVPPVVTLQPVNQTAAAGQSASFTVGGAGSSNPVETILWQRLPVGATVWMNMYDGGSYHGVTTATFTVNSVSPAMSGDQFRAVLVNATDFTTSSVVTLTVTGGADNLFQYPASIARDASGNLYVADTFTNTIRKITPAGVVSTLAGTAGQAGSQDGTGAAARFNHPDGVAVDAAGNVYVVDSGNYTIRKISPAGVVTTLAGTAGIRGSSDAVDGAAMFAAPMGIALDASGNVYVADTDNSTIRKITASGTVTTLAGAVALSGSVDGTGSSAKFNQPRGVAVDAAGNVYVADTNNATIRKITPDGVVTTVAGQPGTSGSADGLGSSARFYQPYGVAVDAAGNIYVADTYNHTIRAITPGGAVITLAGRPGIAGLNDGTVEAIFNLPHGLVVNAGTIYVADTGNSTIRVVSPTDVVSTLAMSPGSTPAADVPPVTPAQPAPHSSGGGGAIDPWFLALIALIVAIRFWAKATTRPRAT